jgi:hypothetical protein
MRLARWIGPAGRVYATEIGAAQLTALRDTVQRERLTNVTLLDAANTTNRPDSEVPAGVPSNRGVHSAPASWCSAKPAPC